jgi:hypothetical protein
MVAEYRNIHKTISEVTGKENISDRTKTVTNLHSWSIRREI